MVARVWSLPSLRSGQHHRRSAVTDKRPSWWGRHSRNPFGRIIVNYLPATSPRVFGSRLRMRSRRRGWRTQPGRDALGNSMCSEGTSADRRTPRRARGCTLHIKCVAIRNRLVGLIRPGPIVANAVDRGGDDGCRSGSSGSFNSRLAHTGLRWSRPVGRRADFVDRLRPASSRSRTDARC